MAGTFTPTGAKSNLTRLELEQLRRGDFAAGGKTLTTGDSALLPEGVIGKGDVNAEPFYTVPAVTLGDIISVTPPQQPGSELYVRTQLAGTPSDTVQWYGPTDKGIVLSVGGAATGAYVWQDGIQDFVALGIQAGDLILIKVLLSGGASGPLTNTVCVVSVVSDAHNLTVSAVHGPGGVTDLTSGVGVSYQYTIIRPNAVQLFAVPGSGPTGHEQAFMAVLPGSTLHSTVGPTVDAINTDRVKHLAQPLYGLDATVDRADSVYKSPAPETDLEHLGYRVVLYPDNGSGTGPNLAAPITSLSPVIDPAIPSDDQRMTIDYASGTIRFSCAPATGGQIKVTGGVNATTGRLNLYAVFWAIDTSATSGRARGFTAPSPQHTSNFSVTSTYDYYPIYSIGSPITATLPLASTMKGKEVLFKDVAGNFELFPLVLARTGGDTLEGVAVNYHYHVTGGALKLYSDGLGWWVTGKTPVPVVVTCGDGVNSAGDFNGANAISDALTYVGTGTYARGATILVKPGSYTASGTLVAINSSPISIIGQGGLGDAPTLSVSAAVDTIQVPDYTTLRLQGLKITSYGGSGIYAVRVSGSGRCTADECLIDSALGLSLTGGDSGTTGIAAAFRRCTFTGTSNEAGLTLSGGNGAGCTLVTADECTFNMGANPVPPVRFRAVAGAHGAIEGLRCTKSRFILSHTTNTGGGTHGNFVANTGIVDLDPAGQDSRPSTAAVVTGSTNISPGGLYGGGGTLNGTTFSMSVKGVGPYTLILSGAGNSASKSALLAAINAMVPSVVATQAFGGELVLTDSPSSDGSIAGSITIGSGTANGVLGLTPGTTSGTTRFHGASVQECSFDECLVSTPTAVNSNLNVLLHLVPQGNGAVGAAFGPYLQVEHFKLKSCRLTSRLGDPANQLIPFSSAGGAAHFEMDDVTFTMNPTTSFIEALAPDDLAFEYTGTGTLPTADHYGYVAISGSKVTAKKVVATGFKQTATIGDFSIRTMDIDVNDIQLSSWGDGGTGSVPAYRLIFEGVSGQLSSGSIQNVKMLGQTVKGGSWCTNPGGLMRLEEWAAYQPSLNVTSGRISGFKVLGTAIGGWPGLRMTGTVAGVHVDNYYISDCGKGIYQGTGTEYVSNLRITRCVMSSILAQGIWLSLDTLDDVGIRIENNTMISGCGAEGIVVDVATNWNGDLWLSQNMIAGNNGGYTAVQILVNASTITNIRTTAMGNDCGGGKMKLLKNTGVTPTDATLAQNLRGWQTVDSMFSYDPPDTKVTRMMFNNAILARS